MSEQQLSPLPLFRFQIDFYEDNFFDSSAAPVPVCSGAFTSCSGIDATMEPKTIKEGGRNYGAAQRVGPVTFSTVVLRRGMTTTRDLWRWFKLVSGSDYGYRLKAEIAMCDIQGQCVLVWELEKALPIKFRAADLDSKGGTEIAIEELHLVHEGLNLRSGPNAAGSSLRSAPAQSPGTRRGSNPSGT